MISFEHSMITRFLKKIKMFFQNSSQENDQKSCYVLFLNEEPVTKAKEITQIVGLFSSPETAFGKVLSKTNITDKEKQLVIAYCMGFFDNEESRDRDDICLLGLIKNIEFLVEDNYSFTLVRSDLDDVITTDINDVVFHGSFKKFFEYLRDNKYDVSKYKPYGKTQKGFSAIMLKEYNEEYCE